jgi:signal transduction histidine kinase
VFPPTIDPATLARQQAAAPRKLRPDSPLRRLREPERDCPDLPFPRVRRLTRRAGRSRWLLVGLVAIVASAFGAPKLTLVAADSVLTLIALCVAVAIVLRARRLRGCFAEQERQRFARDLHDGAQQRLVHTVITLKLARRTLTEGGYTDELVAEALTNAEEAMRELRDLAHGELTVARGGLAAGVETLAARVSVPVDVDVDVGRLPRTIETNAYFIVAETLTNVSKYAHARHVVVHAEIADGALSLEVRDDGVGGASMERGSGLRGLRERAESLGGRLEVDSPAGRGTRITAELPLPDTQSWSVRLAPAVDSQAA